MEQHHLICINCPLGCALTVTLENGVVTEVTGNTCPRGDAYGRKELTNPTRIVTSTVSVTGGHLPVVSVKTDSDIPKEKIGAVMQAIQRASVTAPVHIGDVLIRDAAGTGANIVATKNIKKMSDRQTLSGQNTKGFPRC